MLLEGINLFPEVIIILPPNDQSSSNYSMVSGYLDELDLWVVMDTNRVF